MADVTTQALGTVIDIAITDPETYTLSLDLATYSISLPAPDTLVAVTPIP